MRTSREIFDQTNELAAQIFSCGGYVVPGGFRFDNAENPRAQTAWDQACVAQELLTGTDMIDVIDDVENETLL